MNIFCHLRNNTYREDLHPQLPLKATLPNFTNLLTAGARRQLKIKNDDDLKIRFI